MITSQAGNFEQHTSTIQSVTYEAATLQPTTSTSQEPTTSTTTSEEATTLTATSSNEGLVTSQASSSKDPPQALGTSSTVATEIADEVFIISGGTIFHLSHTCKGLSKCTNPLEVVSHEEAKAAGRPLCQPC